MPNVHCIYVSWAIDCSQQKQKSVIERLATMPIIPSKNINKEKNVSIWQRSISDIIFSRSKRKIPLMDLALFCRKLAYLLSSGLPIKTVLPILQGKSLGSTLGTVVPQVHKRVMRGDSFSDALEQEGSFPEFMLGYIAIGEKTGQLAKACEKLADYYEYQAKIRRELIAALVYPTAVLIMMIGVIVLAMVTVLPGYSRIFEASDIALPRVTALLLDISAYLSRHAAPLVVGIITVVALLIFFAKSHTGKNGFAQAELKIPILRQAINLHLAQALSLLLSSGIKLSEAMLLCTGLIGNVRVKKDLEELSGKLSGGTGFSDALENISYIDPLFCDMARVGEQTGELYKSMERCLEYFTVDYRHSINRLNKLIEPVITLVMGVLIALVMLAVVLPTFELATVM